MKTKYLFSLFIIIAMLSACNAKPSYEVEVTEPLYFQKDKTSSFEIKITEKEKAVRDLKVSAQLSMAGMDHGTYDVTFAEGAKGIYAGEVELPMAGKYEIAYIIENDGDKTEKLMEYTVKKNESIASINGEWIHEEDLDFYRFINTLHIAISRETDKEKYEGVALEEALAYWDAQEELNQDKNQLLTQIIRLRSMALLAIEKGHVAKQEEVELELQKVRNQYNQHEIAKKLIKEYGEEKFWSIEEKQYELIVMSQKVQSDLAEKVKRENPKAADQEIAYLAKKQYEELLVSQINSLKIEIL
jgi:hypothetical protein